MTQKEAKAYVNDPKHWQYYISDEVFRVFRMEYKHLVFYKLEAKITFDDWTRERNKDGSIPQKSEWRTERLYYRNKGDARLYAASLTIAYNMIYEIEKNTCK